jgi:hypothetical protein
MRKKPPKQRTKKFEDLAQIIERGGSLFTESESISVSPEAAIPFRWEDVRWEKDFYYGEKRNIPCLKVDIPPDVTVTIYGSHLESAADFKLTHLLHKSRDVELFVNEPPGSDNFPRWFVHLDQILGFWHLIAGEGVYLKGAPSQTVFQGVMDDPDLMVLLSTVNAIKGMRSQNAKHTEFFGRRLSRVLVPAIKAHNVKKVLLLKKVMDFFEKPREIPKAVIYNDLLLEAAFRCGHVPTSGILQDLLADLDCYMEDSLLYRDLRETGLGWILKKYKR